MVTVLLVSRFILFYLQCLSGWSPPTRPSSSHTNMLARSLHIITKHPDPIAGTWSTEDHLVYVAGTRASLGSGHGPSLKPWSQLFKVPDIGTDAFTL